MADSKLEHLRRLFDRALELPAAARTVFLDSKCGSDPELKRRLRAMLAAADDEHFHSEPAESPPATTGPVAVAAAPPTEGPGTRIGPYRLLQQIGEGGFGAVFMAQQEQPVARTVALKIIKLGMDTRQVVARFEQERQALALMDHPNIARVLDAGATDTGRPYFVMDLVKGAPIVEYCDRNHLTIDERLALFSQVCHAVQHAHGKGIIHRDLKPSNILVGTQDGRPQAKVIDFGIAKATSSKLTDKTLFTEHQQVIGTLQYMSPEQAEGSLDIDTRTDVYSLGVLLYELLSGSTPFDQKTLRDAMHGEIQRMIREVEPPKPSTRLSESHDLLAGIAASRRVEPKRLGMLLRGELDWIVMKALEKDRTRRYETASGMAEDIRRHLAGEAIVAAPPGALYRLSKLVRRHRATVGAMAAVAAALVVGAVGFAWQAQVAAGERDLAVTARQAEEQERRRAEDLRQSEAVQRASAERNERKATAINQFLFDMLGSANLREAGRQAKVAEALANAAQKVGKSFADNPDVEAAVRHVLARTYTSLGMLDEAGPQIEAAMALGSTVYSEGSREFANLLHDLGTYQDARGEREQAAETNRRAIEIAKRAMGSEDQNTLGWQSDYANQLVALQRRAEAETILRETLAVQERVYGLDNRDGQMMVNSLAVLLHGLGKLDEAEVRYRRSLAIGEAVLGPDHADTLTVRMNLASLLRSRKNDAEAEPLMVETFRDIKRVFGDSHPHTAIAALNLARLYKDHSRNAEALPLAKECAAITLHNEGERSPNVARARNLVGQVLYLLGRYAEAAEWNQRAVDGYLAASGPESEATLIARWELAKSLSAANRIAEAEPIFKELLEVCPRVLRPDHWVTIYTHNTYALMLMGQERFAEAEPLATIALTAGRRAEGADNTNTLATQLNLAGILRGLRRLEEAEALGRDALQRCVQGLGPDHATSAHFRHDHGVTLLALGRSEEAESEFTAAIASAKAALSNASPNWCSFAFSLGKLLVDQGRTAAAEPVLHEAASVCAQARGAGDRGTARLRCELGHCLSLQGRFAEADALLVANHAVLVGLLPAGHGELRRARQHLATHYQQWNAAAPDATRAAKAAEWQALVDGVDPAK